MLRSNIDVTKGLLNGAIGHITEIIWPYYQRTQLYDSDIPSVRVDFGNDGIHIIQPKFVQFPAKMLSIVLSWARLTTVDHDVIYASNDLLLVKFMWLLAELGL